MSEGRVTIHTDGACSGNPGPGGYGAILEWRGHVREIKGGAQYLDADTLEELGRWIDSLDRQ